MKTKNFRLVYLLLAPVLSGALLVLAFPTYDLWWLAWVGLVPLLIAVYGKRSAAGFFLALLFGITFFAGVFYWTLQVRAYSLLHQIFLIIYLGSYYGLFGLVFAFFSKRFSLTTSLLAAPFIWVSLEYIRSNMGFMAHPWPLLGHSQIPLPQVIQIADITGAYGVSFLVAMVNSALVAMIFFLLYRPKNADPSIHQFISKRGALAVVITAAFITILTLGYGIMILSKPISGEKLRISVVQGNIDQAKKWDPKHAKSIMQTYTELTRKVLEDQPDLIVWPEAATPRAISLDKKLHARVSNIANETGAYLLLGSSSHQKFKTERGIPLKFRNSAYLFGPEKEALNQRYDKIHLLPFGEYLPHSDTIPWSWIHIPNVEPTLPGIEFTVFQTPNFRFSAPICWETVFPYMVREFVSKGAQFIVNITNEAWFGKTAAPYHFLSSNVFRAVENRTYLVRCGNTGISCFIDPYGRIVDRVKDKDGQDIFVRGILTETVTLMESKTIYTRYGDWLAWMCIGSSFIFLITSFFKKVSSPFFELKNR